MLETLHRDKRIWNVRWRSVFVSMLLDHASVGSLNRMHRDEARVAEALGDRKMTSFTVVPAFNVQPLGEGVRKKSGEIFADMAPHLLGAATLIGGEGFFPSLVRSLAAGAALFSRSKVPQKSFSTIEDTTTWIGELDGQDRAVRDNLAALTAGVHKMVEDSKLLL